MILYLKHIDIEGPETLGDFLTGKGLGERTVALQRGEPLPQNLDGIRGVVCLGGPMNVYEEDKYAFLAPENRFIQQVIATGLPYLGLCLGSQLLSKAAGGTVAKSPQKEVGFFPVDLTEAGRADPLFRGVSARFPVYQWHEDMVQLPDRAVHLASSAGCPMQGFRVGRNAYGLQFHVEITERSIREWSAAYLKQDVAQEAAAQLADYARLRQEFDAVAQQIFENFFGIIQNASYQHTP